MVENNVQLKIPVLQLLASLITEKVPRSASTQCQETSGVTKFEALPTPRTFRVKETYIGKTWEFIHARPGDLIVVHAWIQGNEAMGYNQVNDSFGRIPTMFLEKDGSEHKHLYDTFLLPDKFTGPRYLACFPPWKPGDRIRVCNWSNGCKIKGTGFNLSQGQIGDFSMSCPPERK